MSLNKTNYKAKALLFTLSLMTLMHCGKNNKEKNLKQGTSLFPEATMEQCVYVRLNRYSETVSVYDEENDEMRDEKVSQIGHISVASAKKNQDKVTFGSFFGGKYSEETSASRSKGFQQAYDEKLTSIMDTYECCQISNKEFKSFQKAIHDLKRGSFPFTDESIGNYLSKKDKDLNCAVGASLILGQSTPSIGIQDLFHSDKNNVNNAETNDTTEIVDSGAFALKYFSNKFSVNGEVLKDRRCHQVQVDKKTLTKKTKNALESSIAFGEKIMDFDLYPHDFNDESATGICAMLTTKAATPKDSPYSEILKQLNMTVTKVIKSSSMLDLTVKSKIQLFVFAQIEKIFNTKLNALQVGKEYCFQVAEFPDSFKTIQRSTIDDLDFEAKQLYSPDLVFMGKDSITELMGL